MASVGEKIRHNRLARRPRLSQAALAKQLGLTRDQLANYESGRTEPPERITRKLGRLWRVDDAWFWDGSDVEPPAPSPDLTPGSGPPPPDPSGREATPGVGRRLFPIVGTAGAASFPINAVDEWGDYVEFSDDLFKPGRFAVRVVGDSMEPRLKHGSFVLVQPDPEPPFGLLTVAKNREHEYVVKVRRMVKGKVQLHPINRDYQVITPEEGWEIVGFVVGIRIERGKRKYVEEGDDDGLRPNP